jgi:hypothetical protein
MTSLNGNGMCGIGFELVILGIAVTPLITLALDRAVYYGSRPVIYF